MARQIFAFKFGSCKTQLFRSARRFKPARDSVASHRVFGFLGYKEGSFPVAERIGRTGLHFGVHQYLTEDDIQYAAESVRSYFR